MLQNWGARASACATLLGVCALIGLAAYRARGEGVPYRPAQDDAIVLGVRAEPSAEGAHEAALRARLRDHPTDLASALRLARVQIERARASGDLRPLGRAEAILAPFAEPVQHAEVLVLRATIAQARHDFTLALRDLDRALALAPGDAQAHLTRASLLTVLGRYAEARASCTALARLAPAFVPTLCHANIDGYSGQRAAALVALERARTEVRDASERAWAASLLCEHAFWGGQLARAQHACAESLALDAHDRYTRALYADVLLEAGQAERAFALTPADGLDDALLLRRALAALALARSDAGELVATLQARFAQSRARGDRVHQREEARLLLALGKEPTRALSLARAGFAAQRELWDARVLLLAAAAAHDAGAAAPVLSFLRDNHVDSSLLDALAQRLGSAS
jgi:tetratricopeptide (TPR) repeat protein